MAIYGMRLGIEMSLVAGGAYGGVGVQISGSGYAGEMHTAPAGTTYQWQAGGVNISGATRRYYVPSSTQAGASLSCLVDGVTTSPLPIRAVAVNQLGYEDFAVATDTDLEGYVGKMTWSLHPLTTTSTVSVLKTSEGVGPSSAGTKVYLSNYTPSSADYSVATCVTMVTTGGTGFVARWDPTTLTGYLVRYYPTDGEIHLYRFNAGASTRLAFFTTAALAARLLLQADFNGTNIKVYQNGTEIINYTDASPITSAGRVGLRVATAATGTNIVHDFLITPITTYSTAIQLPHASVLSEGWYALASNYVMTQAVGNRLRFRFSGPELAINMSLLTGTTGYMLVRVGGEPWRRIQHKRGNFWQPLYYNPTNTLTQVVEIVLGGNDSSTDNWTSPTNRCLIRGIHVAAGHSVTASPARSRRVIVDGDSISRGRALTELYRWGDATAAWPWLYADMIGADIQFIAFSGQGFTQVGAGNVPALASNSVGFYYNGVARAADSSIPLVLVAMGTNDNSAGITSGAVAAWGYVRSAFSSAKIVGIRPLGYATNTGSPSASGFRDSLNGVITTRWGAWADSNSQLIDITDVSFAADVLGPAGTGNANSPDNLHPNSATQPEVAANIASKVTIP